MAESRAPRVVRAAMRTAPPSTIDERIEAVWQLTLSCLAWQADADAAEDDGEPRLRRSIARVIRPAR